MKDDQKKISASELGAVLVEILKIHPVAEIYINAKHSSLSIRYTPKDLKYQLYDLQNAYVDTEEIKNHSK
jgi:hypothetical protein